MLRKLKGWMRELKRQSQKKLKMIHTCNSMIFFSKIWNRFSTVHGFVHKCTKEYTSQQKV